jgi:hypothetical protein
MGFGQVLERFIEERPAAVMYRGLLERVLSAERMDALFERAAEAQYDHRIAFSTLVEILGAVVMRQQKSVNAAFQAAGGSEEVGASVISLYGKLKGVETQVSETLVRQTADRLAQIIDLLPRRKPLLPGYRLRIFDGKQLGGSEHRVKETRVRREAVLPGKLCAVLDPDRQLVLGVAVTEDAHQNERLLFAPALELVQPGDCVIADRHFCSKGSVLDLASRKLHFILRQHQGNCEVEELSKPRRLGSTGSGIAYEQQVRVVDRAGESLVLRRITLRLTTGTRDGEREIQVLTNLPAKVKGRRIVELYRHRWQIEQTFQSLAEALRGEVNTLGYPPAALFGYCLALVAFNLLSTVKACVLSVQPTSPCADPSPAETKPEPVELKLSSYYLADEVCRAWDGLDLMVGPRVWQREFVEPPLATLVRRLRRIARHVDVERFATRIRGPKKPRHQLPRGKSTHLSTHRLLATRARK